MKHSRIAAAALTAACLTITLTPSPAMAGTPPTTKPDTLRLFADGVEYIDVTANDTDTDGDEIEVCRIGETPRGIDVESVGGGAVIVFASRPGTYTVTYYACDFETLVPGKLTVQVMKSPQIKVKKVSRPGYIKVRNPGEGKLIFLYGDMEEENPDGKVKLLRHESKLIRVHREEIFWIGSGRDAGRSYFDLGEVKNIRLPKGDKPPKTMDDENEAEDGPLLKRSPWAN